MGRNHDTAGSCRYEELDAFIVHLVEFFEFPLFVGFNEHDFFVLELGNSFFLPI